MNEPPAEILRRLRPIPTYADTPATRPHDVIGVALDGTPRVIEVVEAAEPVLLLFLSADCLGCRDLWANLAELERGLEKRARFAVVTKSPGDEDAHAVSLLAGDGPVGASLVVMSSAAYADYRAAAPFFVVVDREAVLTEGVAWGVDETLRSVLGALAKN